MTTRMIDMVNLLSSSLWWDGSSVLPPMLLIKKWSGCSSVNSHLIITDTRTGSFLADTSTTVSLIPALSSDLTYLRKALDGTLAFSQVAYIHVFFIHVYDSSPVRKKVPYPYHPGWSRSSSSKHGLSSSSQVACGHGQSLIHNSLCVEGCNYRTETMWISRLQLYSDSQISAQKSSQ